MNRLKVSILVAIGCLTLAYIASIITIPNVQGATSRQSGDSCGHVTVVRGSVQESPSCPNDVGAANSYQTTLKVVSNVQISHFDWVWKSFWCSNTGQLNANGYCVSNLQENAMGTTILQPNMQYSFTSQQRTPNTPFASCGIYQNDFYYWYTINGVKCQSGTSDHSMVAAGGVCHTTQPNCALPSATPTPTPFPTSTPTPFLTSTPTPTPTPFATSTPTPTPGNNNTNNCDHTKQGGNNNNNNNNCDVNTNTNNNSNSQNQNQNQSQTQNNNQEQNFNPSINNTNNNNITLTSYAPPINQQQQQIQVAPAPTTNSLPNTGSPLIDLLGLFSMSGVGVVIRRFTKFV